MKKPVFLRKKNMAIFAGIILFFFVAVLQATQEDKGLSYNDLTKSLRWRLLGPSLFGGRISDIAVPRGKKHTIYCASASGGVWKTENCGTTWEPIFDGQGTDSIGSIAISESNPDIVWVGTGEPIAGSHSSWGDGVYKSTDAGKTWAFMGLKDSHQIGKILISPNNSDLVYVAAVGHLWGPNAERGLYITEDGGKTWSKSLSLGDSIGVVDIAMDPSDHNTLYAAAYGRIRGPYATSEEAQVKLIEGGGIFKTTDGGETWTRAAQGLPSDRLGKIGLAMSLSPPHKIYAIVERAPFEADLPEAEMRDIKELLALDKELNGAKIEKIRKLIDRSVPSSERPAMLIKGLSRSEQSRLRSALGQGEIDTGGGVFRSDDGGQNWMRMSSSPTGASFYSRIYVHPHSADTVYVPIERIWISLDGGKSFKQTDWAFSSWLTSTFIHGDFHALWINPDDPSHLIAGTDGGLYSTYDGGVNWDAHHMPIGQFYTVAVDMRNPYYVYGGLQDNGGWAGPSATRHMSGVSDWDWFKYEQSDGGYVQVDPTDNMTVYTEWQYGEIRRLDLRKGVWNPIQPQPKKGETPFRFNFIAPFLISPHDAQTLYMGAQKLLKSSERGNNWDTVSPDLTRHQNIATITTVAESPLVPGLLWAGTDDGNLQVSRDDGAAWINVSSSIPNLPHDGSGHPYFTVSRVEASHFNAGTAYVSLDGHYVDEYGVYLFATNDFGQTWRPIRGNLPDGFPVRVVREDLKNPNLLFVGTALGVYASLDKGENWFPLRNGLPPVRVDDMVIHPRDADLVIGTHGRGIYVLDIWPLQELASEVIDSDVHLFDIQPSTLFYLDAVKNKGVRGARWNAAQNPFAELFDLVEARYVLGEGSGYAPPGAAIYYFLKESTPESVEITILDNQGERLLRRLSGPSLPGINRVLWDLRESPLQSKTFSGGNDAVVLDQRGQKESPGPMVQPGRYKVRLSIGEMRIERPLIILPDKEIEF